MQTPDTPPLPVRNGIAPSYLWLPEGCQGKLLDFLVAQFPAISAELWLDRILRSEVCDAHGLPLQAETPIHRGMCIYYYRELAEETIIPFEEQILYQDADLLVVDKPHFLPVTPSGRFLHETLLVRLKKRLGLEQLSPIHRLDRETAGVMLFSTQQSTRGKYQALFQKNSLAQHASDQSSSIQKTYHAVALHLTSLSFPLEYQSRMEESSQFFIMHEVAGSPNSFTRIDILERRGEFSVYRLQPATGKKHQLRVHLASLGAPILNDAFYPVALPCKGDDFSAPLQLLAKSIAFTDPLSGERRYFESARNL